MFSNTSEFIMSELKKIIDEQSDDFVINAKTKPILRNLYKEKHPDVYIPQLSACIQQLGSTNYKKQSNIEYTDEYIRREVKNMIISRRIFIVMNTHIDVLLQSFIDKHKVNDTNRVRKIIESFVGMKTYTKQTLIKAVNTINTDNYYDEILSFHSLIGSVIGDYNDYDCEMYRMLYEVVFKDERDDNTIEESCIYDIIHGMFENDFDSKSNYNCCGEKAVIIREYIDYAVVYCELCNELKVIDL